MLSLSCDSNFKIWYVPAFCGLFMAILAPISMASLVFNANGILSLTEACILLLKCIAFVAELARVGFTFPPTKNRSFSCKPTLKLP